LSTSTSTSPITDWTALSLGLLGDRPKPVFLATLSAAFDRILCRELGRKTGDLDKGWPTKLNLAQALLNVGPPRGRYRSRVSHFHRLAFLPKSQVMHF